MFARGDQLCVPISACCLAEGLAPGTYDPAMPHQGVPDSASPQACRRSRRRTRFCEAAACAGCAGRGCAATRGCTRFCGSRFSRRMWIGPRQKRVDECPARPEKISLRTRFCVPDGGTGPVPERNAYPILRGDGQDRSLRAPTRTRFCGRRDEALYCAVQHAVPVSAQWCAARRAVADQAGGGGKGKTSRETSRCPVRQVSRERSAILLQKTKNPALGRGSTLCGTRQVRRRSTLTAG